MVDRPPAPAQSPDGVRVKPRFEGWLDLDTMHHLLAVRSHGSIARAADAIGMSRSNLSAAIARLEGQLGARLFDRTSRGSELTAAGEMVCERAVTIMLETESILRDVELLAGIETGVLRIGIGTSLKHNFQAGFLRVAAERYPDLRTQIQVLDRDRLIPLLKEGELDLIICGVATIAADDGLVVSRIMTSSVIAVSVPTHALVGESRISVERFLSYPSSGAQVAGFTNAELLGQAGSRKVSHYAAYDYDPLLALALDGACTLLAPDFVVQPHMTSGALVQLDLDWAFEAQFAVITTHAANYSPVVSQLIRDAAEIGEAVAAETRAARVTI